MSQVLNERVMDLIAKSTVVTYILWLLLGIFGAHRFYLGHIGMGLLYLFTLGLLGIGWLVDLFLIPAYVDAYNMDAEDERDELEDRIEELEDEIDYLHAKLASRKHQDSQD